MADESSTLSLWDEEDLTLRHSLSLCEAGNLKTLVWWRDTESLVIVEKESVYCLSIEGLKRRRFLNFPTIVNISVEMQWLAALSSDGSVGVWSGLPCSSGKVDPDFKFPGHKGGEEIFVQGSTNFQVFVISPARILIFSESGLQHIVTPNDELGDRMTWLWGIRSQGIFMAVRQDNSIFTINSFGHRKFHSDELLQNILHDKVIEYLPSCWPRVAKTTNTISVKMNGSWIKVQPFRESAEARLLIVRDDKIFIVRGKERSLSISDLTVESKVCRFLELPDYFGTITCLMDSDEFVFVGSDRGMVHVLEIVRGKLKLKHEFAVFPTSEIVRLRILTNDYIAVIDHTNCACIYKISDCLVLCKIRPVRCLIGRESFFDIKIEPKKVTIIFPGYSEDWSTENNSFICSSHGNFKPEPSLTKVIFGLQVKPTKIELRLNSVNFKKIPRALWSLFCSHLDNRLSYTGISVGGGSALSLRNQQRCNHHENFSMKRSLSCSDLANRPHISFSEPTLVPVPSKDSLVADEEAGSPIFKRCFQRSSSGLHSEQKKKSSPLSSLLGIVMDANSQSLSQSETESYSLKVLLEGLTSNYRFTRRLCWRHIRHILSTEPPSRVSHDSKHLVYLISIWAALDFRNVRDRFKAIVDPLCRMVVEGDPFACEIFPKIYFPHISDNIDEAAKARLVTALSNAAKIHSASMSALLAVGGTDPAGFVLFALQTAKRTGDLHVLESVPVLVRQSIRAVLNSAEEFCEALLSALDPREPRLRKISLHVITSVFHTMVQVFPMVAFNKTSQRLAFGDMAGTVHVYLLRTATKAKTLAGHRGAVSSIAFDLEGEKISSYSACDGTLRVWSCTSTGFLSGLWGNSDNATLVRELPGGPKGSWAHPVGLGIPLEATRISWISSKDVLLVREDGSEYKLCT